MTKKKNNKEEEMFTVSESEINDRAKDLIQRIIQTPVKVKAKNESQKDLIRSIKANQITICKGLAGTGKTYVALAFALGLLRAKSNKFRKIYLVKSVTTLKGEELGYLKGSMEEKIEPFIWSYVLNLEKIIEDSEIKNLFETDIIRALPLAYARGISLDNCIIIADEMQNISLDNARTLLTRIGENTKMILLGDTNQIDLKNKKESSLDPLFQIFSETENIGVIEMNEGDTNCRNPLISVIEDGFREYCNNLEKPNNNKKQVING